MKSRQLIILGSSLSTLGLGVITTQDTDISKIVGIAGLVYGLLLIFIGLLEGASRAIRRNR
jgi:hypothetical protein